MMLQVKVNFQFGAFAVLLALIQSCGGQHRVIVPSQSLKATVGDDVILPCHLDPAMNAFGMTLEWGRPDLDPRFVYVWRDGVELESKKHPSYKGRTSMFVDELETGNISLRISKVKMSDAGRYRCFVPEVDEEAIVHLVVAQPRVIGPSQSLKAVVGDDIILPCHLYPAMNAFGMTLEWGRPDLDPRFVYVWRDGVELESKKHPSYKDRTSMFVDKLENGNISLRISKVKMSDAGRYRCFVPEVDEEAIVHLVVAQPRVIVPSQPIVATVGDDVILPCHLEPIMNAFGMTLEWANPDLDPRFVYVWRDGVELESKKHPSYKGRTSMFVDELANGNISLRISKVKMSDAGRYRCFVPEVDKEAIVHLVVGAASEPVIQINKNSGSVDLQCDSTGWYPEPEVFWLDGEGNLLSAGPPETVRGPDDLYTVSSRVTVEKRHSNSFTCRVTQKKTNQTRETTIQVPDDFFIVPHGSSPTSSVPAIVGAVLGIMFIVLAVAAGCFLLNRRRRKLKNKGGSLEDGAELTKEEQIVTPKSFNTGVEIITEGEEENVPLMSEANLDFRQRRKEKVEEQRRGRMQQKEEERRKEDQRTARLKKREEDKIDLKPQKSQKQEESKLEPEDKKEKDQEGNQNDRTRLREEESEKRKEEINEKTKETEHVEREIQPSSQRQDEVQGVKARMELPTQRKNDNQEPRSDVDETEATFKTKTAQKDNEQQREANLDFRQMSKEKVQEERGEQKNRQEERRRRQEQRTTRLEDKIEHKPQEGQKQEESKLEPEDKKDKDQEGNQNDRTGMREEEAKNRKEEINEKSKETEEASQLETQDEPEKVEVRMKLPTQEKNDNQEVLDANKQETGHEDKRSEGQETKESSRGRKKNQSKDARKTERKAGGQNRQRNEKLEKPDVKKEEGVNPSVSPAGPDRPDLRGHQETAERNKQEVQQVNELQTEKQQRDEPQRNERESKEQPERSAEVEEVESKGGQEERTDGGADREETQKTCEEIENHRSLQSEVKEETGEQLQESSKDLRLRGAESLDGVKEEETNGRGFTHVTQRDDNEGVKNKQKEEEVCHDHQQQTVGRTKPEEEGTVQTEEDVKTTNQDVHMDSAEDESDELRDCEPLSVHQHTAQTEEDRKMTNQEDEMETEEEGALHTEKRVINEPDEHRVCEPPPWHQHTAQTEEDRKVTNEDNQMETEEGALHTETRVIDESVPMNCDSEPYHGSVCQDDQQDQQMESDDSL